MLNVNTIIIIDVVAMAETVAIVAYFIFGLVENFTTFN